MKQMYETRRYFNGQIIIDKDVPVTMRDGSILWVNVFRPLNSQGDTKVPPIVSFTPYGKDSDVAVEFKRYWDFVLHDHPGVVQEGSSGKYLTWEVPDPERWIPNGYAIVVVDARGTGKSPGYYDMFSPVETGDYYDVIEWAGVQPWSNGKVGTMGVSYLAIKQWQVAALQPPHLSAIVPWEGACDLARELTHHGGIFSSAFAKLIWESQLEVNQHGNAESHYKDRFTGERSTGPAIPELVRKGSIRNTFQTAMEHPLADAYNQDRAPNLSRITVPILSAANWGGLGLHLRGNVNAFVGAASEHKWLETHGDTHFASMYLPEAVALQMRFFDRFLKDIDNGFDKEPPLNLTIRDPRGEYRRKEQDWPLARTRWKKMHLDGQTSALGADVPKSAANISYAGLEGEVTLRTSPFERETEFTGPAVATLFVSTEAKDMDLFLTLRVFDPQGLEVTFKGANDPQAPITQGWLRLSLRKLDPQRSMSYLPVLALDEIQLPKSGEVYEVQVELWPTSIVIPPRYTLALTVGAKDFERPEATGLMRGSGLFLHNDPLDRPEATFKGKNVIHTGPETPSHLLLPEIPESIFLTKINE